MQVNYLAFEAAGVCSRGERLPGGHVNNLGSPMLSFRESLSGHGTVNFHNVHSPVPSSCVCVCVCEGDMPPGYSCAFGFSGSHPLRPLSGGYMMIDSMKDTVNVIALI